MGDPRKGLVREIFGDAVDITGPARSALLDERCAGDPALRADVEILLDHEEAVSTGFLGGTRGPGGAVHQDRPGDVVGPYTLRQRLGEGGMGVVHLAEQTEPLRRQVALKIVKVGMDTEQVVARFEAERQALALMDHPHVATVFDAGVTTAGRPYFAMEYVPGASITEHCDRHRLSIDERLALFMQVCDAVQHAHQKGIIHRDLKPSNILVTGAGGVHVPKVIDFGVAKALHVRLTEHTLVTEHGQLIGTPEYMSPEQAGMSGRDVDTRTDIYALGVLLYELLTGERPLASCLSREAGVAEIQRVIREEDPPKPSTRMSGDADSTTNAGNRRSDPRALSRVLRGDLDWIVMRCLRKDRSERYPTASALVADLQRHLDHKPVHAGPPSTVYRFRKFVRRNRLALAAAVAPVLILVAGIIGTTWGWRAAVQANEDLEQVVAFQSSQLSEVDPELMGIRLREDVLDEARDAMERAGVPESEIVERSLQLEALLDGPNLTNVALRTLERNIFERALAAVDEQFPDNELIRARLNQTMADTLADLGLFDRAIEPQIEVLEIRRRVLGDLHPDTLKSLHNLGMLHEVADDYAAAEACYREALAGARRVLGDEHIGTLTSANNLGVLLQNVGRYEEAEPYLREALETGRRVRGDEDRDTLVAMNNMGVLFLVQGKTAEAEPYFREELELSRRVLGDEHPDTLISINNMGNLLLMQGRLAEAEPYYREGLRLSQRVLGDEHPFTLTMLCNTGVLLQSRGELPEAELCLREAIEVRRDRFGDDHSQTLDSCYLLGGLLLAEGRLAEAEPYLREALEGRREVRGEEHPDTLASIRKWGRLLNAQERYTEAEQLLRDSIAVHERVLGEDDRRVAETRSVLGAAINGRGRHAEAEAYLLDGYAGLDATVGELRRGAKVGAAMERLIDLYEAWGRPEEAAVWRTKLEESLDDDTIIFDD